MLVLNDLGFPVGASLLALALVLDNRGWTLVLSFGGSRGNRSAVWSLPFLVFYKYETIVIGYSRITFVGV